MINKNWSRWIRSSVNKHFDARKDGFHLYVEGANRHTTEIQDFAELRVDGPYYKEVSKDVWEIVVEINILAQSILNRDDLYKIDRTLGVMEAAFENTITVYKLGDGENDDQTILGCLQILVGTRDGDGIITNRFGIIEPDTNKEHATVEAHYRMRLVL